MTYGECQKRQAAAPLPAVKIPGGNHLDRQRKLIPRAYIPYGYGETPGAPWWVPPGGDRLSADIARVEHELLLVYRQLRTYGSNRQAARAFGISETVWGEVTAGKRWMGETVIAALLAAVTGW